MTVTPPTTALCELLIVTAAVCLAAALALVAHHYIVHEDLNGFARCFQCEDVYKWIFTREPAHEIFVVLLLIAAAVSGSFAGGSACRPQDALVLNNSIY